MEDPQGSEEEEEEEEETGIPGMPKAPQVKGWEETYLPLGKAHSAQGGL